MGTGPNHVYTQRGEPMFGRAKVPDFKALDSHIALVLNRDYTGSAGGSEMRCVDHRRFARIASKSNESIAGVAGGVEAHQFFVDSGPNIDCTACPRRICGVLDGAPRRGLSAGIRIISRRPHIEGGVCLAKRRGGAGEQCEED